MWDRVSSFAVNGFESAASNVRDNIPLPHLSVAHQSRYYICTREPLRPS